MPTHIVNVEIISYVEVEAESEEEAVEMVRKSLDDDIVSDYIYDIIDNADTIEIEYAGLNEEDD